MKKVVFVTRLYTPHIGGVEKHVAAISHELQKRGYQITIITTQHDELLNEYELSKGIEIYRIPNQTTQTKASLWKWIWSHRKLFRAADIVHVHDVFWWMIPVISLVSPKLYVTFHGWEGKFPPTRSAVIQRKAAAKLSQGIIHVGEYIEKWYGVTPKAVVYGGVQATTVKHPPVKGVLKKVIAAAKQGTFLATGKYTYDALFVGRLSNDNDIKTVGEFFPLLQEQNSKAKVAFAGDGAFAAYCDAIGEVKGEVDNVMELMSEAKIVCANSYLAIMEAQSLGKLVVSFYSNPLKKDYLTLYPQARNMIIADNAQAAFDELQQLSDDPKRLKAMTQIASEWAKQQSWKEVAKEYEQLWEKKTA